MNLKKAIDVLKEEMIERLKKEAAEQLEVTVDEIEKIIQYKGGKNE